MFWAPCHGSDICIRVLAVLSVPNILNPVAYSGVYTSCLNASKEVFLLDMQLVRTKTHNNVRVKMVDSFFMNYLV